MGRSGGIMQAKIFINKLIKIFKFKIFFGLNFKKSLPIFIILLFFSTSCAPLISSPEGTTTTHVQESGVQVYAPRAARAQKVVFDTADDQMIHESDTPFRKFFNAHASDFKHGKLDYAKATILRDIVAQLKNKEYILRILKKIINRQKEKIGTDDASSEAQVKEIEQWNNLDSQLIGKLIYQKLVHKGYPSIRDEEIESLIDVFFDDCGKTGSTLSNLIDCNSTYFELFKIDLKTSLLQRDYFMDIIDHAVDKRLNLFRSAVSPSQPMQNALGVLKSFVKNNLKESHADSFADLQTSLWGVFKSFNKNKFVDSDDKKATMQELDWRKFRNELIEELKKKLEQSGRHLPIFGELLSLNILGLEV